LSKLFRSVSVVSGTTFLSRLVGFVRDIVCASIFGAHFGFDAFLVAFKIPNFMRRLFAEGAFSQAFVPILSEHYANNKEEETLALIDKIFGVLLLVVSLIVVIAFFIAPYIVMVFAPGYVGDLARYTLTVEMLRITFPYLLFISLIAMLSGIYNCRQHFFIPSFSPIILSSCSICMALLSQLYDNSVKFLAWGVVVAGVLQLIFLLKGMEKFQRLPRPKFDFTDRGVRSVMKLMSAALFGVSVVQIGLMIETFLASFLPGGSISWLYYAERLMQMPLALIAIAVSTVILPILSKNHSEGDKDAFNRNFEWSLTVIVSLSLPAAVGMFCLVKPILITLFYHGNFTLFDVLMTSYSLKALAFGLPAFMLIKVAVSAFYSRRNIKTPVKVAALSLIVDIGLSLLFLPTLKHAGLSLAVASSAWVNGISLLYILLSDKVFKPSANIMNVIFSCFSSVFIMYGVLTALIPAESYWVACMPMLRAMLLVGFIVLGMGIYIAVLKLLGFSFSELKSSISDSDSFSEKVAG